MVKRLSEKYETQEEVEIFLQLGDEGRWVQGRVEAFDFPGIWVRTRDGYRWFVTNGRRIRRPVSKSKE